MRKYMYRASIQKPLPFQRGQEKQAAFTRAAIDRSRGAEDMKVWRRLRCPGSSEWEDASKPPVTAAKIQKDIDRVECAEIASACKHVVGNGPELLKRRFDRMFRL